MPEVIKQLVASNAPVEVVVGYNRHAFDNLESAKRVFPALDPNSSNAAFTSPMMGRINGQPALRFEDWAAYAVYSA